MKYVAVFLGGKSCEHDISAITGTLTLNSIDKNLFAPIPVYVDKTGVWYTGKQLFDVSFYKNVNVKKLLKVTLISGDNTLYVVNKGRLKKLCAISCAINCLHGFNGEDGSLSGHLKLCNVPFASPDIFASAFSMDKDYTKIVLSGLNVDKLPYVRIHRASFFSKRQTAIKMIEKKFGYPVIIKPANLGSSIGISVANNQKELENALELAFKFDEKVIVERELKGFKEINCSAYKHGESIIVSNCEQPITKNDILSFTDKYLGSKTGAFRKVPAEIPQETSNKIKSITEKIYRKCDFLGVVRIDYILHNNKIYVNEINSVPGSLAYYLYSDSLKDFTNLLTILINEGILNYSKYNQKQYEFSSVVLSQSGIKTSGAKSFDKNLS